MKKIITLVAVLAACMQGWSQNAVERPKLVVGVVIDQMRWDYLYRYIDRYAEGGFKRLLNQGFSCENTYIHYLPTYTAPGHAGVYTGSVPALHGIAANDWIDKQTGRKWYCVEDTTVTPVGTSSAAGKMSPRNLLANTIADELKIAQNFKNKSIGISLKDRGAVVPVGASANAAYWFEAKEGNFISSSFYQKELPRWVAQFNQRKIADSLLKLNWLPLYPIGSYVNSTEDNTPYEGVQAHEKSATFPHQTAELAGTSGRSIIRYVPAGNTIVRLLAEACIDAEQLGKSSYTDFLAVSFSSSDYIGHFYGINAIETEDMYLRMDLEIAQLLNKLDATVGKDNYVLFLTADHGGAHNTLYLKDRGFTVENISYRAWKQKLDSVVKQRFGDEKAVLGMMNNQVYLNTKYIQEKGMNYGEIKQFIMNWLSGEPGVSHVVDYENTAAQWLPKILQERLANGYFPNRCGQIAYILHPGWYEGYATTGTTHGGWNPYDSKIPLLFYGWKIPKGLHYERVYMHDIAPTLSSLLKIQEPNANIGKAIKPLIHK